MNNEHCEMVLKLLDEEAELTHWEWDFVNSLADYEHECRSLTAAQSETLNDLYAKVSGR